MATNEWESPAKERFSEFLFGIGTPISLPHNKFLTSEFAELPNSEAHHKLWRIHISVLMVIFMFALAALMSLIGQVSGTPYIPGGDSPAGTDCSGLASWVANVASGRPAYGSRFHTGNMESALLARGFHYGSAPNSVVIGWNGAHAAVTLPDGTPVSSGESGAGVRIGGGGAFQPQFTRHMYLPVEAQEMNAEAAPADPLAAPGDALPGPTDLPGPAEAVPGPAEMGPGPADAVPGPAPVVVDVTVQPETAPVPGPDTEPPASGMPAPEAPAVAPETGPVDPAVAPAPETAPADGTAPLVVVPA